MISMKPRVSAVVCLSAVDGTGVNRTLLGRHKEMGLLWPGGKVDENELVEEAACRELYEETGIQLEPYQLTLVSVFQHSNNQGAWVAFLYTARVEIPNPIVNGEPEKFYDWHWKPWAWLEREARGRELGHAALFADHLYTGLQHLVMNASRSRENRLPGCQTHCFQCRGQIPCRCMRGES